MKKRKKKGHFRKKMLNKYRLIFINESTLEEKASFRLNRLNVFLAGSIFAIVMIILTSVIIIYTPLREYILGFSEVELHKKAVHLSFKTDSLERELRKNELYISTVKKVLQGDIQPGKINKDSIFEIDIRKSISQQDIDLNPIREDSILRQDVAEEERYNVFEKATQSQKVDLLFPPINGSFSNEYNPQQRHYGIDIVAPENTPVKAVADGTVIFSEWTAETGYVIIIEHGSGFISIYKHNSSLSKKQGEQIKAGEVIATIGNTGELTTGPHLHFELWENGYPVNPKNYIQFEDD